MPEEIDVEVDEESYREFGELEVGEQLEAVDGGDGFHRLYFDYYEPFNDYINAKRGA